MGAIHFFFVHVWFLAFHMVNLNRTSQKSVHTLLQQEPRNHYTHQTRPTTYSTYRAYSTAVCNPSNTLLPDISSSSAPDVLNCHLFSMFKQFLRNWCSHCRQLSRHKGHLLSITKACLGRPRRRWVDNIKMVWIRYIWLRIGTSGAHWEDQDVL
jgi:hypothetical protein